MSVTTQQRYESYSVGIPLRGIFLNGDLVVPPLAEGVVLFAHGSGSGRFSQSNRAVAAELNAAGFATLLLDLLTPSEERWGATSATLRFDVHLLARRLTVATDWVTSCPETADLAIGYLGASTGAAAALIAAAHRQDIVRAIVSQGGRPDLAGPALDKVRAPTLLIVGGDDAQVVQFNRDAYHQLPGTSELVIVPHASHLSEEPGALEQVARLACTWYRRYLVPASLSGVAG